MIKIIKKEPFRAETTVVFPIMMIKDKKEIYIRNKTAINDKEYERTINILKASDGKYTVFYGAYDNPLDMLQNIVEQKQTIRKDLKEIFDISESEGEFTDFIGSTSPSYAIFNYRIYDDRLLKDIKEIVELINRKEWDIANIKIREKNNDYKEMKENIKKNFLGLEFEKFYQLIDKQLELVKANPNIRIFKNDIGVLKDIATNTDSASIIANNLLKHICNLSECELKEYVNNYKKGLLDPYFYDRQDNEGIENEELEQ